MTNLIIASFVTVVSAALGEVDWEKVKVREKERKEKMIPVLFHISPYQKSIDVQKSVDFLYAMTVKPEEVSFLL